VTTTYIYALVDPRDNQIRYVGKTVNPKVRLHQHMKDGTGSRRKEEWLESLRSLSVTPEIVILAEVDSENCFTEEKAWIKKMIADGSDLVNGKTGRGGKGTTKKHGTKRIAAEKHCERRLLSVKLTREEWEFLSHLQIVMGCTRSQVVKQLIRTAEVQPVSIEFIQPEEKVTA